MNEELLIKLFDKPKIIGLVADQHTGKTNTIYHIIEELRKVKTFNLCYYGLRVKIKGTQINSVEELEQIRNSLIVVDEFFNIFNLEDRRCKAQIENTIRLIHHHNNILLLCGLGENFKKFISAKLNAVIFKKLKINDLINGSRVKDIVVNYKGNERGTTMLELPIEQALIYDGLHYHKVEIPYLSQYDSKKGNCDIFCTKKCSSKSGEKKHEIVPIVKDLSKPQSL